MNRAVSDTLGFVFAFAIVTASVGAVYVSGMDGLRDARDREQLRNMERAFDVIDDNLRDIHAEGAPSRASEINLPGGTLGFLSPMRITVQTNGTGCAGACPRLNNSTVLSPQPIAYTHGDTRIVYAAGAVFRTDGDRAVMRSEPGWINDSERALIPGIVTYGAGERESITGDTTVLLVAHRESADVRDRIRAGSGHGLAVNVTVESVRAAAWKRYFEAEGYEITRFNESGAVVSATFETDRVYVSQSAIAVEIER